MKVLFILEYYEPHIGGVETLFKSLAQRLVYHGYDVTVLTNRYERKLDSKEIIEGVKVVRYSFFNRYIFTFLAWIPGLWHASGVDIIHTTSYNAGLPTWIVGKLRRKKTIITFHEYWGALWFELPWMNRVSRWMNSFFEKTLISLSFDRFVAVSDYTKDQLLNAGLTHNKLCRIYNGIDYTKFADITDTNDSDIFQFLFFGRAGYSKGIDLLLQAVHMIDTEHKYKLKLILSPEPLLKRVTKLMLRLELSDDIITIEHSKSFDELKQSIHTADCVIVPSYSEGFCYAAVETMAIGTAIISSGRGALSEVISGRYIEMSTFDPAALAQAMNKALMGQWNCSDQKQFLLSDTIDQYLKLYEQIA